MAVSIATPDTKGTGQNIRPTQAPPPGPLASKPSLTDQAAGMAKDMVMKKGVEMASAPVETAMQTGFDKVMTGIKGAFTPASPTLTALPGGPTIANASTAAQSLGPTMAKANMLAAPTAGALPGTLAAKAGAGTLAGTGGTTAAAKLAGMSGGAAAGGGMAALGAAVPYIGMGLLAGKAFGLFNRGGEVHGPLSLAGISKVTYKNKGGGISEELQLQMKGPLSQ